MTKERKVYLESQSKRILERRGVDTKDGVEGVWEGRRVGAEEVRGLEGLVQVLGRGKAKDVSMEDTDAGAVAGEDGEAMDTS
jgi:kinetochore protein Mis12/MTW1